MSAAQIIGVCLALIAMDAPVIAQTMPDPALTPGVVRYLSRSQVCAIRWGRDRRYVTQKMLREVAAAYHVPWERRGEYEFDHLIPRALGGDDKVANLWAQPLQEAKRLKDPLEVKLHRLVCSGQLSLNDAQEEIRRDWQASYVGRIGPLPMTTRRTKKQ